MSEEPCNVWLLESHSPYWIGDNYAVQPASVTAEVLRAHIRAAGGEPSDLRITLTSSDLSNAAAANQEAFALAEKYNKGMMPLWPTTEDNVLPKWTTGGSPMRHHGPRDR